MTTLPMEDTDPAASGDRERVHRHRRRHGRRHRRQTSTRRDLWQGIALLLLFLVANAIAMLALHEWLYEK
jgi:hypothetical protein